MDTRIKDALVMSAFRQAIGREHPGKGLIIHTDRETQYTSHRFSTLLLRYSCQQSMSRKGNPYDNAIMESFYRTLKRALVQGANYDSPEQAKIYYNTKRLILNFVSNFS